MVTHFLIGDGERSISEPLDNYTDHPVLSSLVPDGNDHCECTNKMSSDINKNGEFKIPSDPVNTISTPNDTKSGNGVDSVCSRVLKPDYSFLHDPDSGGARERFGSPIGPNVVSCMSPLATGPRIHSSKSCSVLWNWHGRSTDTLKKLMTFSLSPRYSCFIFNTRSPLTIFVKLTNPNSQISSSGIVVSKSYSWWRQQNLEMMSMHLIHV